MQKLVFCLNELEIQGQQQQQSKAQVSALFTLQAISYTQVFALS